MKQLNSIIFLLVFCLSSLSTKLAIAQTNKILFGDDFEQALKVAKALDKNIFVDVYADWCVPCKMMDQKVFTDPEVVEFMNKRFISVKIDAEREGRKFARQNNVYGFPTLLFFSPTGEEIHRVVGYANENRLMRSADISFRNPSKQHKEFKKQYKKSKNDPIFLKDYIAFAEEIEDFETADKIADQYAKNYKKERKVDWMDFVMRYVYKEKSKLFSLLDHHADDFKKLYGEDVVNKVYLEILVNSAIGDQETPETQDVIKKTRKRLDKYNIEIPDEEVLPSIATRVFNVEIPFKDDDARTELAAKVLKDYSDKIEDQYIRTMLVTVAVNKSDKANMQIANKHLDSLIAKEPNFVLHDLKSIILYKLGEKEESYKQVAVAKALATKAGAPFKSSLRQMKTAGMIE